jgi:hypothetical protein
MPNDSTLIQAEVLRDLVLESGLFDHVSDVSLISSRDFDAWFQAYQWSTKSRSADPALVHGSLRVDIFIMRRTGEIKITPRSKPLRMVQAERNLAEQLRKVVQKAGLGEWLAKS